MSVICRELILESYKIADAEKYDMDTDSSNGVSVHGLAVSASELHRDTVGDV
jgi:hypothetical protein